MSTFISHIKERVQKILNMFGYSVSRKNYGYEDPVFFNIYISCKPYTMTTIGEMFSLYNAVCYIVNNAITGDIVECGVWKGGSSMVSAITLLKLSNLDKVLYLYDTFEGMSAPSINDYHIMHGTSAEKVLSEHNKKNNPWCYSCLEETRKNMLSTGYPEKNIVFIKGKVEETLPATVPNQIALLRLDTDFYESTYHELIHLFPKLVRGGVMIIDDYDSWAGQKKAVDKYFKENNVCMLLNKAGKSRIGIKL